VRRATLKVVFCSLEGVFGAEQAVNVIATEAAISVDKHLLTRLCTSVSGWYVKS